MSLKELCGFIVFWFLIVRVFIWLVIPLLKYIWIHYRFIIINSRYYYHRRYLRPSPSNWAVITGGTDGIGLAYCRQLARLGYPILVISRRQDKLERVRESLCQKCPESPEIRIYQFDFAESFESQKYDQLEQEIQKLPNIDVLVNNVGTSFRSAEFFTEITRMDPKFLTSIINVNVVSVFRMTFICLKSMLIRRRGIIINISSISALSPMPLLAVYSATKACIDYFTRCLSLELREQFPQNEIFIQSILPGYVATNMTKMSPSRWVPSADDYVSSALKSLGHTNRSNVFWLHSIQAKVNQALNHLVGPNFYTRLAFKHLLKLRQKHYCYNNKEKLDTRKKN